MKTKTIKQMRILLLVLVALLPLCAMGQAKTEGGACTLEGQRELTNFAQFLERTERSDCNLDGTFNMDDLSTLINYLLTGSWNDYPADLARDTVTVNGVEFVMVKVEGGSYAIEEGVTATVRDFWIGQMEVTQQLWQAVMGSNPSYYPSSLNPVNNVSWDACQSFISRLNELTGLSFRLPSSIEWEWAARGGNYSHGYEYAGSNNPDLVANHKSGSHSSANDVGRLHPNELGLYDMSGNIAEWCQNEWNGDSSYHIMRSGSYGWPEEQSKVVWISHAKGSQKVFGLRLAM